MALQFCSCTLYISWFSYLGHIFRFCHYIVVPSDSALTYYHASGPFLTPLLFHRLCWLVACVVHP